jgi:single-stranded-DNA-specific exonuclease
MALRLHPPLPDQRWAIAPQVRAAAESIAQATQLSPLIAQVLINRGLTEAEAIALFLHPEQGILPDPVTDFADLAIALDLLIQAIGQGRPIAICGDYDADGMTSTALLMRSLSQLGAQVDYAIPSRMDEGYGINCRIIEEFHAEGVGLVLTVDNGITAVEPIARARELGLNVIITDHHDVPERIPPANAILNPKLIAETSPYRGLAGVGVAYILAVALAEAMGQGAELSGSLLELFTLGTIADLAPLTGVNRRWVRQGLALLPYSRIPGIQALIEVAGLGDAQDIKPEAIGFRLGPRINAIGRIGDPQVVIELLTTDDRPLALERAIECEQINKQRQQLCEQIETEALLICQNLNPKGDRILTVVQSGWHHGVIGIVASRLVERFGVPVFIGTYEDAEQQHIRGSARGIPEFNVFDALTFCHDDLGKYGGHRAAGGFSLAAQNLPAFRQHLIDFAHQSLDPQYLKPLVNVDVEAPFLDLDLALYAQIDALHPCGIGNPDPVFWSANVQVQEQKIVGKGHIKLVLNQPDPVTGQPKVLKGIAWRWGDYFPLPPQLDIAYRLRTNEWKGEVNLDLEVIGGRGIGLGQRFTYGDRPYQCTLNQTPKGQELRIHNSQGAILAIAKGEKIGSMLKPNGSVEPVDVSQPFYFDLIKAALLALNS